MKILRGIGRVEKFNYKPEKAISKAIEHIIFDRARIQLLMDDLQVRMLQQGDMNIHRELGQVMAKYVETMQRSNEQLVKLAALIDKREKNEEVMELTPAQKEQLYDEITKPEGEEE